MPVVPPVNMIIASSRRSPSGVDVPDSAPRRRPGGPPARRRRRRRSPRSATTCSVGSCRRPAPSPSTSTARAPAASLRTRCSLTGSAGSNGTTISSARRRGQQADDEFGVAACAQRDPITRPQTTALELPGKVVSESDQVAVADRDAIGGGDQRRRLRPPGCRRRDQIGDQVRTSWDRASFRFGCEKPLLAPCRATFVFVQY